MRASALCNVTQYQKSLSYAHFDIPCISILLFSVLLYTTHKNRLALELAEQNSVFLPTTAAANAVYVKAMEECNAGDQDFSAVIQAYQK